MKFIIDTDPGTDDAVAILIALAHFTDEELLAITTVGGKDRKSTRLNSSHSQQSRMPSSA